jgi:multidrug efflux pump subunit AcrB
MNDRTASAADSAEGTASADGAPLGVSGRLARAFQSNALTPLLAIVALLLGLFAVLVTPREEEPQINVTMANVLIPFPGASSVADVQNMVARPAEQVLSQIAGIEHTYSVSRPGMALLTVQFQVGVPRTEALVRLYDVLNANQDWLPRGLGTLTPIVKPKGIDDVPVLAVTLWGRDATAAVELERVAHAMEAELKRVPGAREVQTIGGPGRVVQVTLQPARLRERGVDVLRLRQALAGANLGMPAGAVIDDDSAAPRMLAVETGDFLKSAARSATSSSACTRAARSTCARWPRWRPARRSRCATSGSRRAAAAAGAASAPAAGAGYPAVTITVTKKPGENAVDVSRAARARVDELRNTIIPAGIEATVTRDYGATANEKANKLIQKLAFATGSVILLVGLALGRREAVIVGAR